MNFDHIIIGAVSAGCAVAKRLSESGLCQVAVADAEGGATTLVFRCRLDILKQRATIKSTGAAKQNNISVSPTVLILGLSVGFQTVIARSTGYRAYGLQTLHYAVDYQRQHACSSDYDW